MYGVLTVTMRRCYSSFKGPFVSDHKPISLLNSCKSMEQTKQAHAQLITTGLLLSPIRANKLLEKLAFSGFGSILLVESDQELQSWWTEIRTVGHADKKDEPWWPVLKTQKDLIDILTTITWVTSAHHAAANFGQYAYGGYFPNRPTIARTNMPTEDPTEEECSTFMKKPERALWQCFTSQLQATRVMAVLDILSNHSPDEEYLGEKSEQSWAEDPFINEAFERFHGRLRELERIIDERNANSCLKNRVGAGVVPYELLKPFSSPGVTGKGVPYSISI